MARFAPFPPPPAAAAAAAAAAPVPAPSARRRLHLSRASALAWCWCVFLCLSSTTNGGGFFGGFFGTASAAEITITSPKGLSPGFNNPWPFTYELDEDADPAADLFFTVEPLLGTPFVPQKVVLNQNALDGNGNALGAAGVHTITIGALSTLAVDQTNIVSVTPSDASPRIRHPALFPQRVHDVDHSAVHGGQWNPLPGAK